MSVRKTKIPLSDRCLTSLIIIGQEMRRASVRPHPGEMAWGQYFDYDHLTEQTGVYGSAAAVKTLAILGESVDSEYIKGGLEWLRHSYDDKQSRASSKNDWSVIYKLCYFLEALNPDQPEINEDADISVLFRNLIDRRLPDDGWGEYYFTENDKDPNFSLIGTAIALYVLRRYVPFSGSNSGKQVALLFCRNLISITDINLVSLALAIIAVHGYSIKHEEIRKPLGGLIKILENKIKNTANLVDFDETHHGYSVKSETKYVRFPIEALVSYALIISGRDKWNRAYINNTVKLYTENIISNKGYLNREEAPRKSTVNHYWLTLLLKSYIGLKEIHASESMQIFMKKDPLLRWIILISITLLIWIGSYILIQSLNGYPALNAISFIIGIAAPFFVNRIWENNGENL